MIGNGTWTPMLLLQVLLSIAAGLCLYPHWQAFLDETSPVDCSLVVVRARTQ